MHTQWLFLGALLSVKRRQCRYLRQEPLEQLFQPYLVVDVVSNACKFGGANLLPEIATGRT
jgi:hypothetical protein